MILYSCYFFLQLKDSAIYNNNFARPRDRLVSTKNVGLADSRVYLTAAITGGDTRDRHTCLRG